MFALVKKGTYANKPVKNVIYPVLKDFSVGKNGAFLTVDGSIVVGPHKPRIRVIADPKHVEFVTEADYIAQNSEQEVQQETAPVVSEVERMAEIEERFQILEDMTKAMMKQKIRGMIVSGPPGVGKSFGVEQELNKLNTFTDMGGAHRKTEVVKGAMTALGLYVKLNEYSDPGSVLVFDDCDSVLMDDLSLNILKAALDSSRARKIFWNADSNKLKQEGVPNSFEFKGSVCFITNIKFENVRSKRLQDHLQALQSRCHYLDLTLDSLDDRMMRVKQIATKGDLFANYGLNDTEENEIIDFMSDNASKLNEVSLRMALKIADCKVINGDRWKNLAQATCMKRI